MKVDDKKFDPAKTYMEKLSEYVLRNDLCEIALDTGEILGKIIDVGKDYICLTRTVEREIFTYVEGEDGKKEKVTSLEIIEMETILKLEDVVAVSKVMRKTTR